VLIARALAQGADHLILDEPTNHLDIRYQMSVLELVAGLGVTVLAAPARSQSRRPVLRHRARAGGRKLPAVLLAAAMALGACGSSADPAAASQPPASSPAPAKAAYPVTMQSCGSPVTFTSEPKRAVSNDVNTTEDMLALGLQSRMVGDFGVTGDGPVGHPVPAQYLTAFHQVRDVSSDYFTLETLVGLHPDFLFAGWNYGLEVGTRLTPAGLATSASRPWRSTSPAPMSTRARSRCRSTTPTRTWPISARSSTCAAAPTR
jgi:hypothetical protein